MKDISVIIVTYYTTSVLFRSISSCMMMKGIKEVIVINNGNPEEYLSKLQEMQSKNEISLVDGHGNVGFAKACNIGAAKATGQYLMFINPDCYTDDKDFALKLREAIESNTKYWFATSLILNPDGTVQKTCRRNLMTLINAISQSLALNKIGASIIDRDIKEIASLQYISEIEAFSGALFFCHQSKFHKVGGLSEEYFLHVEDMDLCMKIWKAGGRICFVKNAVIYHKLSTSLTTSKFLELHKARGFIIYFQKFFAISKLPILKQVIQLAVWARFYLKTWNKEHARK